MTALDARVQALCTRYFAHMEERPSICFGRGKILPRYRRIQFGVYDLVRQEIRIHPIFREYHMPVALDFVIYHELLHFEDHAARQFPPMRSKGRVHNQNFRQRERQFHAYEAAMHTLRQITIQGFRYAQTHDACR